MNERVGQALLEPSDKEDWKCRQERWPITPFKEIHLEVLAQGILPKVVAHTMNMIEQVVGRRFSCLN